MDLFPSIVSRAKMVQVISPGLSGHASGSIIMVVFTCNCTHYFIIIYIIIIVFFSFCYYLCYYLPFFISDTIYAFDLMLVHACIKIL
jgi:hypothetical protein